MNENNILLIADFIQVNKHTIIEHWKAAAKDKLSLTLNSSELVDDLPLFAVPSRAAAEPAPPSEAEQMMEAVKALHPDEMTPREALDALYKLKTLAAKAGK